MNKIVYTQTFSVSLQFKESQSLLCCFIKMHSLDMLEIAGITLQIYLKCFPAVHCFPVLAEFFLSYTKLKLSS